MGRPPINRRLAPDALRPAPKPSMPIARRSSVRQVSGTRSCYAEPVAVRVFEIALPSGKSFLIDRDLELLGDSIDVIDIQMDESVRARVTLVFREIEPDATSGYRDEQRKARLELMLPLLAESKPLVPGHGTGCVLDIENWNDLFFHGASPSRRFDG